MSLDTHVKTILDSWTLQRGYPVVGVHRLYDKVGGIHFTQNRFMDEVLEEPAKIVWHVPVNIATQNSPNFEQTTADLWFSTAEHHHEPTESQPRAADDEWMLINKQQGYYYRVNYDDKNWGLIAKELNGEGFKKIHLLSRAQLMDDALDLARYNHLNYAVALQLVNYLSQETDLVPWRAADPGLTEMYRLVRDSEQTGFFMQFMRDLSDKFYTNLGAVSKSTDDHLTRLARILALKWCGRSGHVQCWADTLQQMTEVIYKGAVIEADLKSNVYCTGMRSANATVFNDFLKIARESTTDRAAILTALGCNEDESVHGAALDEILKDSSFTDAEKQTFFNNLYTNSANGYRTVLAYINGDNADAVKNLYGGAAYGNRLYDIAAYATTTEARDQIEAVLVRYTAEITDANKARVRASMAANIAWVTANGKEVQQFLISMYDDVAASVLASTSMIVVAALTSYYLF